MSLKDSNSQQTVFGCIIAGGANRRMSGAQKLFLALGGKTLYQHIVDTLEHQVGKLALNINDTPELQTALPLIADESDDLDGPIAGVIACLEWLKSINSNSAAPTEWLLTTPSDSPILPNNLVQLLQNNSKPGLQPKYVSWQTKDYYLTCLWHISALPVLHRYLSSGKRSVRGALQLLQAERIIIDKQIAEIEPHLTDLLFFNINTPEDYEAAKAQIPIS